MATVVVEIWPIKKDIAYDTNYDFIPFKFYFIYMCLDRNY